MDYYYYLADVVLKQLVDVKFKSKLNQER
jgi:hypothetical protein